MTEFVLAGVALILCLGIAAQWISWRFQLPTILMLLVFGILAGPVFGILNPDVLFGDMLSPFVALGVSLLLFENGLELRISEPTEIRRIIRRLVGLGGLVTLLGCAFSAWLILGFGFPLGLLLGALLIASGPTVVIPLLREMPLRGDLGAIVRGEGRLGDVAALVSSLLIFTAIRSWEVNGNAGSVLLSIASCLAIGIVLGVTAARLLTLAVRSQLLPDSLRNPVALALAVGALAISNMIQTESGLLTALVMGVALANQSSVSVRPFIEFRENLRVLFLSMLFIVLAARTNEALFAEFNGAALFFLAVVIALVRPIAVLVSSWGSSLQLRERLFLAAFAPRGIVPAALGSLFALELIDVGYPGAERLVPVIFLVIGATVTLYGLGAPAVARSLRVSEGSPRGVLILGAHDWARALGRSLQQGGLRVILVDTNEYNVVAARREGLTARCEDIFFDRTLDEVVLEGVGRLFALTSNDEVNTLASLHFSEIFGGEDVYQLPFGTDAPLGKLKQFRHRFLFDGTLTFEKLEEAFSEGFAFQTRQFASEIELRTFLAATNSKMLVVISAKGEMRASASDRNITFQPDEKFIFLEAVDAGISPITEKVVALKR